MHENLDDHHLGLFVGVCIGPNRCGRRCGTGGTDACALARKPVYGPVLPLMRGALTTLTVLAKAVAVALLKPVLLAI